MEKRLAPDLTPGYPSKGKKLGPAWAALWDKLLEASAESDPYLDGRELAGSIAGDYGLAPDTLVALLSRAAQANILTREGRPVETARGARTRTWYTISADHKVPVNA